MNEVALSGYNLIRRDRDRHGGGVAMFIRNDITFSERSDLYSEHLELCCIELLLPKTKPIIVCCCYRPPNQSDFLEYFEDVLLKLRSDVEWFFVGDFNICFKQKNHPLYDKFCKIYV